MVSMEIGVAMGANGERKELTLHRMFLGPDIFHSSWRQCHPRDQEVGVADDDLWKVSRENATAVWMGFYATLAPKPPWIKATATNHRLAQSPQSERSAG